MTENVSRIGKTHQESLEDLLSRREPWSGFHSMSSTTILNSGLNHMFSNLTDSWKRMFITSNLFLGFLLALVPDNALVNVSKNFIFRYLFFPLIPGERFAMTEMKIAIVKLLQKFTLHLDEDSKIETLKGDMFLFSYPDFKLKFVKR